MLGLKRSYDRFNFEGENGSSISKVSLELRQLILHTPNKRSLARAEDEKKLKNILEMSVPIKTKLLVIFLWRQRDIRDTIKTKVIIKHLPP